MSRIDDIVKQIRQAQAEAIRGAGSIEEAGSSDIQKETERILAENIAKQKAAQTTGQATTPAQQVVENTRTTQQKYEDAQKAYDDYKETAEYQQGVAANNQNALKQVMDMMFAAGASGADLPANLTRPVVQEDSKAKELEATANYYKNQMQAEENQKITDADLLGLEKMSAEDRQALELYATNRNRDLNAPIELTSSPFYKTAEQEAAPLIEKYGKQKVDELAESFLRSENQKAAEDVSKAAQEGAGGSVGGAVGHSAASVGANLIGSMTGSLGYLQEAATGTGRYSTLDPNNAGNLPNLYAGAVREEVAQNIEGEEKTAGRKLLSYGYQGVMSAADSLARAAAFGYGSLGLAAAGSFSQTLSEASRQGATPEQALILATGSAALEVATEKIPLDEMLNAAKGGAKGAMQIAGEALKQAGIEITTEEISLFGNLLLEAAVLQENSSYKQQIGEAVAHGASYEDAKAQANKAVWNEALQTAFVSGFSGAASGGGSAVIGSVSGQVAPQVQQQVEVETAAPVAQETPVETENQPKNFVDALAEQLAQNAPKEEPEVIPENQRLLQQATNEIVDTADNVSSVKEQIRNNQSTLNSMEPVANIQTPKGFADMTKTERKAWVIKKLQPTNYTVDRKNFGIIKFAEKQLKSAFNYLKRGSAEEASFEAIPYVLENGKEISSHAQHKDREYGTVTFAAPVIINGKRGNMAVVVKRTTENFYKVHRILTPDGSVFNLADTNNEAGPSLAGESPETGSLATPINPASNAIISEGGEEVKGTGAAEKNFSGKAEYQNLLYEGNVQRDREGDARPVEVPKTDTYGRNVSEFVGNAYGAEITPDSMANEIEKLVQEGALGFDRRSNQDALNDAAGEIEEKGMARIRNQITRNVANGKLQDGDIEKAMLLYSMYANKKGEQAQDNASELFVDLTTMAHMSGRNLQLFGLLRKLTPEGQASAIKKMVQQNVENMVRSGQVKKGYETEVDPELLKEYQDAARAHMRAVSDEQKQETQERMQEIQQVIFASEAAKMPATMKAKWDAWRYMAMLGNAKTQVRNLAGNALFMPYKTVKDKMSAVFEKALPKDQRTKAVGTDFELLAWARNDAKTGDIKNALQYSAKLGDDVTSAQFAENRQVFNSKALDAVRKFVEKVPQAGDMLFKNGYYASSLASFLKARGYQAEDIHNGNVSDAVLNEARGYAIQEAMKATFNDCNAFSDAVAGIGRKKTDNPWGKALNVAAEGILPFRRTPANIAVRFAEYSPAGLVKGVWDMATKVQNGDLSAAAAIDQISAGLTGSAVMTLGYFLAKGIGGVKITGSGTDEDEKRQGHQDYAVEFSIDGQEYSYKIDWAAPANLPLFVGANIYKAMEEAGADTDVSTFTSILHGMGTMFEPMLALSCMSSLNDLVEGIRYAPEGEALYSAAADIATSYFTQGIPALARQAYQASQVNKQTTFANSDDSTIRDLQKTAANIPFVGARFQTDKLNAWGETETTESGLKRAFNAFFNPGTVKQIDNGALETEINRLNNAQSVNVSPPTTSKTISYTDNAGNRHKNMRMTEQQYQTLATTQGQTAKKLLTQIIANSDYQDMTDSQKAAVMDAVYEYAQEAGKKAAFPDYYSTAAAWMGEIEGDEVNGLIRRGALSTLNSIIDNAVKALGNGWTVTEAVQKDMDKSFAAFAEMSEEAKAQILAEADGDTARFLEVMEKGISTDQFVDTVSNIQSLQPEEGYTSIRDIQKREAIANTTGLSPEEIDIVMKAYMPDYDPEDENPDKTELKYDYARQEIGLTPAEYVDAYRVQLDGGKKAEKIQSWQDMGYTYQEALLLYNLFAATGSSKIDVESWHNSK